MTPPRYARDSNTFAHLHLNRRALASLAFVGFDGVTVTSAGKVLGKVETVNDPYVNTPHAHIR
jgi:hypothetical protein